jgi:hypothetical protein
VVRALLGLYNKLLKGREGGEEGHNGIIYKLLEGSRGDGKEVVRKKDKKKLTKKF